jgi:ribonuclease Z
MALLFSMRAKHCLLTHFSQRYPKFPPLSDAEDDKSPDACHVAVAFDLMSLKIGDFWKFRHFVKPFEVLFSEMEADDGNDGTGAAAVEDEIVAPGKEQAGQKKKTMDTKPKGKQAAKLNQQKQKEQAVMVRKEKKGKQSNGSAAAGTPVA